MTGEKTISNLPVSDTRGEVLEHLLKKDLTAIELEGVLNINESAVRRHLDILEQAGYIEHYFKKAKRGRPKKYYKITKDGKTLFPKKTELLLILLVEKLKEHYGKEELESLLDDIGDEILKYFPSWKEKKNLEDRMKELIDAFEDFGFLPSLSEEEGSYLIEYRNCVFDEANDELKEKLCEIHENIVKNSLGNVKVEKKEPKSENIHVCKQVIKPVE